MQPTDPPLQPPEDLPPLVQRPDPTDLQPSSSPHPVAFIPLVLPAPPKPPQPGFWMACVWTLVFFLFIQGVALVFAAAAFAGEIYSRTLSGQTTRAVLNDMLKEIGTDAQAFQESPLFARLMAWAYGAAEVSSVLFGLLIVRFLIGRDWKRQLGLVRPSPVHVVLVILAAPVMITVGDLVYELARHVLPGLNAAESTMKMAAHWPWWFSVLVIGVGPGVGEELWCRGFLGRGLVGRYGFVGGTLLTSFFFGLMHADPPHVVAACAMGLLLHYVYLTTRCLWLPMLLHFLNNAIGALATSNQINEWLPGLKNLDDRLKGTVAFFAAFAVLAAGVLWALYVTRTRLIGPEGRAPDWKPPYPGAAAPPEGSGTVEAVPGSAWLAVLPALVGAGGVAANVYLQLSR